MQRMMAWFHSTPASVAGPARCGIGRARPWMRATRQRRGSPRHAACRAGWSGAWGRGMPRWHCLLQQSIVMCTLVLNCVLTVHGRARYVGTRLAHACPPGTTGPLARLTDPEFAQGYETGFTGETGTAWGVCVQHAHTVRCTAHQAHMRTPLTCARCVCAAACTQTVSRCCWPTRRAWLT